MCFVDILGTKFMTQKFQFGAFAENLAADFLIQRGYSILDKNFRRKWGEIDLVACKNNVLVFIEVKASIGNFAGFEPEHRAGRDKMLKVLRTAKTYLSYNKLGTDREWQLDVVAVTLDKATRSAHVKHFKNIMGE